MGLILLHPWKSLEAASVLLIRGGLLCKARASAMSDDEPRRLTDGLPLSVPSVFVIHDGSPSVSNRRKESLGAAAALCCAVLCGMMMTLAESCPLRSSLGPDCGRMYERTTSPGRRTLTLALTQRWARSRRCGTRLPPTALRGFLSEQRQGQAGIRRGRGCGGGAGVLAHAALRWHLRILYERSRTE